MTISVRAAEQPTTRRDRDLLPALLVLVALMFGVPSMLVFEPLGSSATPAAMVGTALFGVWISTRLVGGRPPSGPWARPMHLALIFFAVAILLSVWVANLRAPTGAEMRSSDRGILMLIAWSGVCLGVADGISSATTSTGSCGRSCWERPRWRSSACSSSSSASTSRRSTSFPGCRPAATSA